MTDQSTPVTDDDRKAHEWASDASPSWGPRALAAARAIKAYVPAPPATLADEIREADWNGLGDKIMAERFADRVEAVEKHNDEIAGIVDDITEQRDEARAERDEFMNDMISSERKQAKLEAEVERLTRERDAAQEVSFLEEEAVGLSYWLADALGEDIDDQSDETLTDTVQRLVNKKLGYPDFRAFLGMPPATALPDSADLPEPDETVMPGDCIGWDVGEDLLVQYAPRTNTVALEDFYGHGIRIVPDDARSIAYALLAAADYAERNQT